MFTQIPPDVREQITNAIKESINSLYRIDAERDHLKEIAKHVKEIAEIKPAVFNKMVSICYKQNASEEVSKIEDIVAFLEILGLVQAEDDE